MLRRLLITFVLVLVLGLVAFFGVQYFTTQEGEETLPNIPFPSTSDDSKIETSSESTSSTTGSDATKSPSLTEKPTESSGPLSKLIPPFKSTETTPGVSSETSSEGRKETEVSTEKETSGTSGSIHLSGGKETKPLPDKTETSGPSGTSHPSDDTRRLSDSTTRTSTTSPSSGSIARLEPESKERPGSGKKERPESSWKERDEESPSGTSTAAVPKKPGSSYSESESSSSDYKRPSGGGGTYSKQNVHLNVVSIGFFRTENEAKSVAPYIVQNAGLSDYMVTKAQDGVYYTIQVGAYANKDEADRLVERLSQQRFPVRLESKKVPVSVLHRN
jgi:cytoskeletal protein RodZ